MNTADDARIARWKASCEGARFACQHCWQGLRTEGSCTECGSRLVLRVRTAAPDPPKGPYPTWLTFPQMEWLSEYRRRARLGLEQLVPKTSAQIALAEAETKRAVSSSTTGPGKAGTPRRSRAARSRSR